MRHHVSRSRPRSHSGFTAAELLVVVAVLLILSAIAVPSMLEAMVRSRVARTHVDMREVATALEFYTVDHNRYPTPTPDTVIPWDGPPNQPFNTRLSPLVTTPVAYISTLVEDPFLDRLPPGNEVHYILRDHVVAMGEEAEDFDEFAAVLNAGSAVRYMIVSNGPDLDYEPLWFDEDDDGDEGEDSDGDEDDDEEDGDDFKGAIYYDPTNGTVSSGDVIGWSR